MYDDLEEQLKHSLEKAIELFNMKRAEVLVQVQLYKGQTAVIAIEKDFFKFREAYYIILKNQLNKQHKQFLELVCYGIIEINKLNASIQTCEDMKEFLDLSSSVMKLLSRILEVLCSERLNEIQKE